MKRKDLKFFNKNKVRRDRNVFLQQLKEQNVKRKIRITWSIEVKYNRLKIFKAPSREEQRVFEKKVDKVLRKKRKQERKRLEERDIHVGADLINPKRLKRLRKEHRAKLEEENQKKLRQAKKLQRQVNKKQKRFIRKRKVPRMTCPQCGENKEFVSTRTDKLIACSDCLSKIVRGVITDTYQHRSSGKRKRKLKHKSKKRKR